MNIVYESGRENNISCVGGFLERECKIKTEIYNKQTPGDSETMGICMATQVYESSTKDQIRIFTKFFGISDTHSVVLGERK